MILPAISGKTITFFWRLFKIMLLLFLIFVLKANCKIIPILEEESGLQVQRVSSPDSCFKNRIKTFYDHLWSGKT